MGWMGGSSSTRGSKARGNRFATVTDPNGYHWVLTTFKKLVPFS
jgi:hypothetical protein